MNKRCENCIKQDVCKYIDEFDEFVKNKEEESDKEFVEVSIMCKFKKTTEIVTIPRTTPWDEYPYTPLTGPIVPNTPYEPYDAPYDPYRIIYGTETGKIDGDNINIPKYTSNNCEE